MPRNVTECHADHYWNLKVESPGMVPFRVVFRCRNAVLLTRVGFLELVAALALDGGGGGHSLHLHVTVLLIHH